MQFRLGRSLRLVLGTRIQRRLKISGPLNGDCGGRTRRADHLMKKENHPEVTNVKTIAEILSSPSAFECLLGTVMLFDRDSKFFRFSGLCTACLLDYEDPQTTIMAFLSSSGFLTAKFSRESLVDLLKCCDVVVCKVPEDSFFLE